MRAGTRVGRALTHPAEILEVVAQVDVSLNYVVLGWLGANSEQSLTNWRFY